MTIANSIFIIPLLLTIPIIFITNPNGIYCYIHIQKYYNFIPDNEIYLALVEIKDNRMKL